MSYVSGFGHDIFISYARENNAPDPHDIRWVTDFRIHLDRELANLLPGKADIYFDTKNYEAGHNIEDLLDHVRNSALLMVILSPAYLQPNKFTLKELMAFCEASPPHNRVILIELFPTDRQHLPKELQSPKPTQFYEIDEETNIRERLTRRFNSELYVKRLTQVATHIGKRLSEAGASPPPRAAADIEGPVPNGPTQTARAVLMAKCTDDLVDEPGEVKSYLEQFGIRVLPEQDYPVWGTEFVAKYEAELQHADLVVQLLSSVRSEKNDKIDRSCAQFQYEAAIAAGRPVLQWQHPEIEKKLAKVQHHDVEFLKTAPNVRRIGLEQFKREIKEELARVQTLPPPRNKLPNVFIAAAQNDLDCAIKLRDKFKSENCLASVLATEVKQRRPQAIRKDFHEKVSMANAVVFFYGEASTRFVDQWMFEYVKHHVVGRERIEAVYHAPPPPGLPLDSDWPGLLSVGSRSDFTLGDAERIVAELRRAAR